MCHWREFHRRDVAGSGTPEPGFEVELNTGATMPFRATWDPADKAVMCMLDGSRAEIKAENDDVDVVMMFNSEISPRLFYLPPAPSGGESAALSVTITSGLIKVFLPMVIR